VGSVEFKTLVQGSFFGIFYNTVSIQRVISWISNNYLLIFRPCSQITYIMSERRGRLAFHTLCLFTAFRRSV